MKNVFIIAGETSGDLHGSGLVRELRNIDCQIKIWGIGGEKMRAAGMETEYDISQMAFLGFSEVIRHLPFIWQVLHHIKRLLREQRPDLVILIDYPGFNLRIAAFVHHLGLKVLYYISPQVWAWGKNRVKKIARFVDRMAVIFKFEEDFYRNHNVPVTFVGHPLLDSLQIRPTKNEFYEKYHLTAGAPVMALLPGSRIQEIHRLLPDMVEIAGQFKWKVPEIRLCVSISENVPAAIYDKILQDMEITRVPETYPLMAYSSLMLVASGTATVEGTIVGTPFVVVYKVSPFSYWLAKKLIKVDYIAMANIIAGQLVVPEFIQDDFCPGKVLPVLLKLQQNEQERKKMESGFNLIRKRLGSKGSAKRVAELAFSMMREND
ncbi:MAG TPA: lipid-A-disaccharide synthase [Bacteroidetes bacterium]|nr:lipid-A-disaccharide synthase [Bacteroidota bacterium]